MLLVNAVCFGDTGIGEVVQGRHCSTCHPCLRCHEAHQFRGRQKGVAGLSLYWQHFKGNPSSAFTACDVSCGVHTSLQACLFRGFHSKPCWISSIPPLHVFSYRIPVRSRSERRGDGLCRWKCPSCAPDPCSIHRGLSQTMPCLLLQGEQLPTVYCTTIQAWRASRESTTRSSWNASGPQGSQGRATISTFHCRTATTRVHTILGTSPSLRHLLFHDARYSTSAA